MARSSPPAAILLALALALPALAIAEDPVFVEDFESGDDGWTANGEGLGVSCGDGGCTLRVAPPCCSYSSTFEHAVNVPLAGKLALDVDFHADSIWGDTDSAIWLLLDNGGFVALHTTEWYNNGLTLQTDVAMQRGFAEHRADAAWTHLRILVDGDARLAQGQIFDANLTVLDASNVLPFGNGTGNGTATAITGIRVHGVAWSDWDTYGFDYDNIALGATTADFAEVVCSAPYAYVWSPNWEVSYPWTVEVYADGWAECGIDSWALDFGDGTGIAGTGYPQWYNTHTYNASGVYTLTLTVTQVDGQTAVAQTTIEATRGRWVEQTANGHLRAGVAGMEPRDDGFIVLDQVANGTQLVSLSWRAIGYADLDLRFYDAAGVPLGGTACGSLALNSFERCRAPSGAAFVDVVGTAVGADWSFTYEYFVEHL